MEAIKETISQMNKTFHMKLAEFEERQVKLCSPSSADAASLSADFSNFKTFVISALRTLQTQVEINARTIDTLEMHNRRKVLLLHGVSEDKADISAAIVETIVHKLKLVGFKAEEVSRCHRMGRLSDTGRPRPILFQLQNYSMRMKVWAAKKNLKSSGITLSEFLTKPRHDTFKLARQQFGVSRCWTHEGSVFVLGGDGVRHRVSCTTDLEQISVQAATSSVAGSREPTVAVLKEPSASARTRRVTKK